MAKIWKDVAVNIPDLVLLKWSAASLKLALKMAGWNEVTGRKFTFRIITVYIKLFFFCKQGQV